VFSRRTIKILALDYDSCLVDVFDGQANLLSLPIVRLANSKQYKGAYGITHRCYYTQNNFHTIDYIEGVKENYVVVLREKNSKLKAEDCDPANALTFRITDNFIAATRDSGLVFHKVSTPDDNAIVVDGITQAQRCGYAYSNILVPYEKELLAKNPNLRTKKMVTHSINTTHNLVTEQAYNTNIYTKNQQLIQIAQHAVAFYGSNVNIEIHYLDDKKVLCESVANIADGALPTNVLIKSFHHDSRVLAKPIDPLTDPPTVVFPKASTLPVVPWRQRFGVAIAEAFKNLFYCTSAPVTQTRSRGDVSIKAATIQRSLKSTTDTSSSVKQSDFKRENSVSTQANIFSRNTTPVDQMSRKISGSGTEISSYQTESDENARYRL
jgi:hypothetical protein